MQSLPAIHHVPHGKHSVCCRVVFELGHVRSCPPPTRCVPICLRVPIHDTGIVILGDDELQYRPTLAALSKNKWWEFKTWDSGVANLGQLARIGGVLWDEIGAGVHFGGCAGDQPSHTTCTVHGPDVSCSRLGEAVGTASGITSVLPNTESSTEFGVPACQPLQRIRPPQGWSAVHAIGVAAPEGSVGGEDPRSRRAAVH